jgi:hypothetical protein
LGGDWSEFLQCSYHEIDVFEVRVDGQTRQPHCERVEYPVPLSGLHIAIQARESHAISTSSCTDRVRLTACGWSSGSTWIAWRAISACFADANGIRIVLERISGLDRLLGAHGPHIVCQSGFEDMVNDKDYSGAAHRSSLYSQPPGLDRDEAGRPTPELS